MVAAPGYMREGFKLCCNGGPKASGYATQPRENTCSSDTTKKPAGSFFSPSYEASEFGSPYIEAEFLLVGMLREDPYVVTRWLGEGDWQTILREDVAKHVYRGPKTSTSVDLPLSNEAKRILAYAAKEAQCLNHPHIGTEHLFLGLLRESNSNAARMLTSRGVDIRTIRKTLAKEPAPAPASFDLQVKGRSIAGQHQGSVEVHVVPEGGLPWQVFWRSRIPAAGEIISREQGEVKSVSYQVVKVEWKIGEFPAPDKVFIHVRELREGS